MTKAIDPDEAPVEPSVDVFELHHLSDPEFKVTVTDDQAQAYLDSGYVRSK